MITIFDAILNLKTPVFVSYANDIADFPRQYKLRTNQLDLDEPGCQKGIFLFLIRPHS